MKGFNKNNRSYTRQIDMLGGSIIANTFRITQWNNWLKLVATIVFENTLYELKRTFNENENEIMYDHSTGVAKFPLLSIGYFNSAYDDILSKCIHELGGGFTGDVIKTFKYAKRLLDISNETFDQLSLLNNTGKVTAQNMVPQLIPLQVNITGFSSEVRKSMRGLYQSVLNDVTMNDNSGRFLIHAIESLYPVK
eukprot:GHVO01051667.1.p1 GENE.GHVO01051667.1~~GHVO01051667.1.p1  ORF type:complete len:194 (+),score=18.90 GHVO01051667.1:19-600(+)